MRGGGRAAEDARIVKGADYASDDEEPLRNEDNVCLALPLHAEGGPCIRSPLPAISALAVGTVGKRTRRRVLYAHH